MRLEILSAAVFLLLASVGGALADRVDDHIAACVWASEKPACEAGKATFRKDFPKAYRGDYQAQRNVAFCLHDGCNGAVQRNPILACAWRLVIGASGSTRVDSTDTSNVRLTCGRLDDIERDAAKLQAKRLVGLILGRR